LSARRQSATLTPATACFPCQGPWWSCNALAALSGARQFELKATRTGSRCGGSAPAWPEPARGSRSPCQCFFHGGFRLSRPPQPFPGRVLSSEPSLSRPQPSLAFAQCSKPSVFQVGKELSAGFRFYFSPSKTKLISIYGQTEPSGARARARTARADQFIVRHRRPPIPASCSRSRADRANHCSFAGLRATQPVARPPPRLAAAVSSRPVLRVLITRRQALCVATDARSLACSSWLLA
jgi:hypothetical protein